MSAITVFSPAKLNLMLAVMGRRTDGFHELVSVVAPVKWGDTLQTEPAADFSLVCDVAGVPTDGTNLILRAAEAFRVATGWRGGARFTLTKQIPLGAGLGGGSSNAVAALQSLNTLANRPLAHDQLLKIAATLGSDCPLFLAGGPVIMRGRGEQVERLPPAMAARLRDRRVLIFKPAFAISTAWAYAQLAAGAPRSYVAAAHAEARVAAWRDEPGAAAPAVRDTVPDEPPRLDHLLFNSMEPPAFGKFPALPLLLEQIARRFGLGARMSGSGSACFALLGEQTPVQDVVAMIRAAWGPSAIAVETQLG